MGGFVSCGRAGEGEGGEKLVIMTGLIHIVCKGFYYRVALVVSCEKVIPHHPTWTRFNSISFLGSSP